MHLLTKNGKQVPALAGSARTMIIFSRLLDKLFQWLCTLLDMFLREKGSTFKAYHYFAIDTLKQWNSAWGKKIVERDCKG